MKDIVCSKMGILYSTLQLHGSYISSAPCLTLQSNAIAIQSVQMGSPVGMMKDKGT